MKELYEVLKKSDYEMYKDDAVFVEEETAYIPSSDYRITKPIRLIELFAGIGSQAMALRNIGADFEHYRVVEFDKYAIGSYNAIHGTDFPTMDITKTTGEDLGIINRAEYEYIMTYSFPCTDLSVAGKMEGMKKGSGTRSGLLWEVERLLRETDELPQILLMENVPQIHGKDNMEDFEQWLNFLTKIGYKNYFKDLNAKDYGIPQNRQRCFMVSILGDKGRYSFPKKKKLTKCVSDYLEDEVDEKYYIRNDKSEKLINQLLENSLIDEERKTIDFTINDPKVRDVANCIPARYDNGISKFSQTGIGVIEKKTYMLSDEGFKSENRVYDEEGIIGTLEARDYKSPYKVLVSGCHLAGEMDEEGYANDERVYYANGSSPTIRSMGKAPNIITEEAIKEYNKNAIHQQDLLQSADGICKTIPAGTHASTPHLLKTVVAMRGRNPENPTSRVAGLPTEQRLELNGNRVLNTLTSVQKDNLILEENGLKEIGNLNYDENGELTEHGHRASGAVYDEEGLCPTINTCSGGDHEPKMLIRKNKDEWIKMTCSPEIYRFEVPQSVRVRQYEVDVKGLKALLKSAKKDTSLSNKEIAEKIGVPVTTVEHFFRQDDSFAIPSEDIWLELKKILNITTDEYDESILTFVTRDGVYEQANRCYGADGVMATITASGTDKNILYNPYNDKMIDDVVPTQTANCGAQNTSSTVYKLENKPTGYCIRKLTPRECWRLMGFSDTDYDKAASVCSNSQLYKQAGNSIVVNCLEGIFKNLIEPPKKKVKKATVTFSVYVEEEEDEYETNYS